MWTGQSIQDDCPPPIEYCGLKQNSLFCVHHETKLMSNKPKEYRLCVEVSLRADDCEASWYKSCSVSELELSPGQYKAVREIVQELIDNTNEAVGVYKTSEDWDELPM